MYRFACTFSHIATRTYALTGRASAFPPSPPLQRPTSKTTGHCALGKPSKNSLMLSLDNKATWPPPGLLWPVVLAAAAAAVEARELGGARREEGFTLPLPPRPPRKAVGAPVRPPPRMALVLLAAVLRLTTMLLHLWPVYMVCLCVRQGEQKTRQRNRDDGFGEACACACMHHAPTTPASWELDTITEITKPTLVTRTTTNRRRLVSHIRLLPSPAKTLLPPPFDLLPKQPTLRSTHTSKRLWGENILETPNESIKAPPG